LLSLVVSVFGADAPKTETTLGLSLAKQGRSFMWCFLAGRRKKTPHKAGKSSALPKAKRA
jgi:hypothetical protein